jgi:maltose-binding protein MalE
MTPAARNLYDDACSNSFLEGRAAITFRSLDLLLQTKNANVRPEVAQNTAIAVVPGVPFVGGSNLVIWNHVLPVQEALAVDFVRYLTQPDTMMTEYKSAKYTPANVDALNQVELDPTFLPLTQSLKQGRALKRVPLWGLVEDKLVKALHHVWQAIFATPEPEVEKIIENNLLPLEDRLNITLSQ